eukprot:GILK01007367.1.p1 GENE.GILK01007367.1~~GILK01007367.1.p1  ORF type:complete len:763 (+),score=78.64 GILK01007367.1:154-2442(+)
MSNSTEDAAREAFRGSKGDGVATTLIFGSIVFFALLAVFIVIRKRLLHLYTGAIYHSKRKLSPDLAPKGWLDWIPRTLFYSDEQMLKTHGLDAVMYILSHRTQLLITAGVAAYSFVVLLPIFASGTNDELATGDASKAVGLAVYTQANLQDNSLKLWAAVVGAVWLTALTWFMLYRLMQKYLQYRQIVRGEPSERHYTVMVSSVSVASEEQLYQYFDRIEPGTIQATHLAYHTPKLDKLQRALSKAVKKLAEAEEYQRRKGKPATTRLGHFGWICIGQKVPADSHWRQQIVEYRGAIAEEQNRLFEKIRSGEAVPEATRVGFVTFRDMRTAQIIAQCVVGEQAGQMVTQPAPEPHDIYWRHLHIGQVQFYIRSAVIGAAGFFLIFFWAVPVTAVQGLSNLVSLSRVPAFEFLDFINRQPVMIQTIFTDLIPALVLVGLMALLVPIIGFLSRCRGMHTKTDWEKSVFKTYYYFLVVNVFLVATLVGSVFNVLRDLLDVYSFNGVIELLAISLPEQAPFFMNYIIVKSLSGQATNLLAVGFLFKRLFSGGFRVKQKPHDKDGLPKRFEFAENYASVLIIWTLTAVYANIAPIVLGFSLLYYTTTYLVHRYKILYFNVSSWESGGSLFLAVFHRLMVGLLISQATLAGLFGIKKFTVGSIFMLVLFAATMIYTIAMNKMYKRPVLYGYLMLRSSESNHSKNFTDSYVQPSLAPVDGPDIETGAPNSPAALEAVEPKLQADARTLRLQSPQPENATDRSKPTKIVG